MDEEWLTTREAAARLGVTRARVLQLIADGVLVTTKRGRDHLLRVADVERARGRRTVRGPRPGARSGG